MFEITICSILQQRRRIGSEVQLFDGRFFSFHILLDWTLFVFSFFCFHRYQTFSFFAWHCLIFAFSYRFISFSFPIFFFFFSLILVMPIGIKRSIKMRSAANSSTLSQHSSKWNVPCSSFLPVNTMCSTFLRWVQNFPDHDAKELNLVRQNKAWRRKQLAVLPGPRCTNEVSLFELGRLQIRHVLRVFMAADAYAT